MTGSDLAVQLVARGLDPLQLRAKAGLFELILAAFRDLTGEAPRHAWWVPGRLEVFGKHTDYAGGRTLVCAAPRGFAVVARARPDGSVRVVDARRGDGVTLHASHNASFTGWRHYIEVAARRLSHNFPGASLGADIVLASDLPRASGLSSSSALVVAVAAALARVAELPARPEWQANIGGALDVAGYYACVENGLTFGALAGDAGVGTHGGSEDHAAILAAAPGMVSAFAFVPMRPLERVPVPEAWRFLIAPSAVKAAKTGAAQAPYNHLARGAGILLELWHRGGVPARSLGAAIVTANIASAPSVAPGVSRVSGPDRLRELVRQSSIPGWPADALERRLDHFLREDARVPDALAALRDADAVRLSVLSEESQADAEVLLRNQIPETIALASSARRLGAFAACSFGAGFGGSVWALIERERADDFAARWHRDAFVAIPGPPLTEL